MIIYNVTVNIENDVEQDWLHWMKTKHIPDVMNTGCFTEYKICRIIGSNEGEGTNYAIQYYCKSLSVLQKYQGQFAPSLQKEHGERYKDKFVAIRTLLEVI